jgi:AAA family ATP:ADP antiporter
LSAPPAVDAPTATRPGPLDRALRLFSDVRAGEAVTVLLMLLNLFLLMVGYYIMKTVREALILAEQGAAVKSYSAAGQALLLMGFIPLYGWFSSRVDRVKLVVGVTAFFILNVEMFYAGSLLGIPYLGVAFFIWLGIFNMSAVAQFWSYGNDIYSRESGERLFPVIGIGATAGSWVGAKVAEELFEAGLGPYPMLQLAAAILAVHLVLYLVVNRRTTRERAAHDAAPLAARRGGFGLVFRSPYLFRIGLLLIFLNLVNTTGEYILDVSLEARYQEAAALQPGLDKHAFIGSFKGNFFFWVNLVAVLTQALLVSRIVRYLGVAGVVLALPVVAFGAYGLVGLGAAFAATRWAKTVENATDYSVMNTAKQVLWLPTSRDEKYKAKQAVDVFFVRTGDVLSAGLVYAGTHWLTLGVGGFARANLALIVLSLVVARQLLREHRALCVGCEEPQNASPART